MAEQRAENPIKKVHNPNIFLSKDEFIEKRQKEKALKAKMDAYEKKAKAEIESEDNEQVVEDVNAIQTVATVKKKGGRPKKVETV